MAITTIAFSDLDTWLSNQSNNTKDTPYELNITGLTADNVGEASNSGTLGNILQQYGTKYVSLKPTTLPNNVFMLLYTFYNCASLVEAPVIPDIVNKLEYTFQDCTSLKRVPIVPETSRDMVETFSGCTSLESITIKVSPSSMSSYNRCFKNTPSTLKIKVPEENLDAWKAINPSDWGLTSVDVFEAIVSPAEDSIKTDIQRAVQALANKVKSDLSSASGSVTFPVGMVVELKYGLNPNTLFDGTWIEIGE